MQSMDFYQPINPIERAGSEPLNELKVSVRYGKGGINYFNYKQEKRGVYVHFKPVHRGNGFETCTLLSGGYKEDGFKMFVRELGRMSQKQLDDVARRIEPLVPTFAEKWNAEDWQGITEMVNKAM